MAEEEDELFCSRRAACRLVGFLGCWWGVVDVGGMVFVDIAVAAVDRCVAFVLVLLFG